MIDKLNELIRMCKASIYLSINDHKSEFESVQKYFEDDFRKTHKDDFDKTVFEKMVETNTIITLSFYPDNAVGFYIVYHYDVEQAIEKAIKILNEEKS